MIKKPPMMNMRPIMNKIQTPIMNNIQTMIKVNNSKVSPTTFMRRSPYSKLLSIMTIQNRNLIMNKNLIMLKRCLQINILIMNMTMRNNPLKLPELRSWPRLFQNLLQHLHPLPL